MRQYYDKNSPDSLKNLNALLEKILKVESLLTPGQVVEMLFLLSFSPYIELKSSRLEDSLSDPKLVIEEVRKSLLEAAGGFLEKNEVIAKLLDAVVTYFNTHSDLIGKQSFEEILVRVAIETFPGDDYIKSKMIQLISVLSKEPRDPYPVLTDVWEDETIGELHIGYVSSNPIEQVAKVVRRLPQKLREDYLSSVETVVGTSHLLVGKSKELLIQLIEKRLDKNNIPHDDLHIYFTEPNLGTSSQIEKSRNISYV